MDALTMDGQQTAGAALFDALRAWAAAFAEFNRRFGAAQGLHASDSEALIHIVTAEEAGELLTPTQLSRRLGLTTGATSSLVNRLEAAGHVERSRDQRDRRTVTLRSTPAVHEEVERHFVAVTADLEQALASVETVELERIAGVVARLTGVMTEHLRGAES